MIIKTAGYSEQKSISYILISFLMAITLASIIGCTSHSGSSNTPIPDKIQNIMDKSIYSDASWSLRVVDLETNKITYNLNPRDVLFTGSLRKTFSVGTAIDKLGADHRFRTPVHRQGQIDADGVLDGDLILVASGDLTMGGRNTPEGTVAFTDFDHVDANPLGGAILTKPDPLGGINELAAQIAQSGITEINGDVIIDDRLFDSFVVPNDERLISPIVINDNLIDVTITPTESGELAMVDWRPKTSAFAVEADVVTVDEGGEEDVTLFSFDPPCFGFEGCIGRVQGQIPEGFKPQLPGVDTFVQTFKIEDPSAFARTALIDALIREGMAVNTNVVGPNPNHKLPPPDSYTQSTKVAELVSLPYSEYAKLILSVSHNYGANLSLALLGVENGVRTVEESLEVERDILVNEFGIPGDQFDFPTNGSGSPDSQASGLAVDLLMTAMSTLPVFPEYFDAFPVLGGPGSLRFADPGSPATGRVHAKTGTSLEFRPATQTLFLKANSLGGYIDAQSDRRLIFVVFVNGVVIEDFDELLEINDDLAKIATAIYELN